MNNRPTAFEEKLKAALMARMPQVPAPAPARSFARRYGIPLAVAAATAVTAGLVVTVPGSGRDGSLSAQVSSTPAPAVSPPPTGASAAGVSPAPTRDGSGTITLDMPRHSQVPGLVEQLRALGVTVVLMPKKSESQCPYPSGGYRGPQLLPGTTTHDLESDVLQRDGNKMVLKINSRTVPPGYTLVFGWPDRPPTSEQSVSFGVKETSKLTPCEIDNSRDRDPVLPTGAPAPE
ncbi:MULTISPECIES: hypothetical protein [unclassified Streptomyces]|uniref:hypothetical protein n=1 Tax=unclassified Streptomyces TaxID=2593676 RepID=UPI002E1438D9|nr:MULTISPECIES: hypothetical protein [unclassified Streptomyces]WSR24951.1 hypothetical protein OG573_01645 [Streptomyces sp. NBC_01205]